MSAQSKLDVFHNELYHAAIFLKEEAEKIIAATPQCECATCAGLRRATQRLEQVLNMPT